MGNTYESNYSGSGALTRDQFLFHETRITAKLMCEGHSDDEIIAAIERDNLFQFPTERAVKKIANGCIKRLRALNDSTLVDAIASQPSYIAKQICLYAMMKRYRIIWDFMITVIGEKYRLLDMHFSKIDLNSFFVRLQEQNDEIAALADSTTAKIKQVIMKTLVENEYLDDVKSEVLNPVLICPELENSIRSSGDEAALAAFNCFM